MLLLCLMFFCFFLFPGGSLRAFTIRPRQRAVHLLGLSILEGQFYCHPQTFPITGRLGNVIINMTLGWTWVASWRWLVSDEARFGMIKESCVQPPLSWKQKALFWFMASKASVHDCVASCTWEEHCGNKSMRQRTAVQTVVNTEQRLWWDRLGSSSIKDLHLVTNLLPPATSPYLVRTNLSVNELLEGNALCPNYNNGVRGKGRQRCWLM